MIYFIILTYIASRLIIEKQCYNYNYILIYVNSNFCAFFLIIILLEIGSVINYVFYSLFTFLTYDICTYHTLYM